MKVYYVTQVLKQGTYIKTVCPYYILEFRNTEIAFNASISMLVGQDRKCYQKSSLLGVREVPGSIPSQGPRHTKDVIKMVPVLPWFSTEHSKGKLR